MFRKIKKFAAIPLTLALCLSGSSAVFATDNTIVDPSLPVIEESGDGEGDIIITPFALLINQSVNFNGEGTSSFTYSGTDELRFYLKNTGTKDIYYKVKYPSGSYLLGSSSSGNKLSPGDHTVGTYDVFGVHGTAVWGTFTVYVYNDDGSSGSYEVSARTIE